MCNASHIINYIKPLQFILLQFIQWIHTHYDKSTAQSVKFSFAKPTVHAQQCYVLLVNVCNKNVPIQEVPISCAFELPKPLVPRIDIGRASDSATTAT